MGLTCGGGDVRYTASPHGLYRVHFINSEVLGREKNTGTRQGVKKRLNQNDIR